MITAADIALVIVVDFGIQSLNARKIKVFHQEGVPSGRSRVVIFNTLTFQRRISHDLPHHWLEKKSRSGR